MRHLLAAAWVLTAAPVWAASVVIENAWIRLPAPGQTVAAAYCDIRNDGATPVSVVAFTGPVRIEMHETRIVDGVARMRPVRALSVPARSTITLEPGGKHLMLFGLDSARLGEGEVTLRAELAGGGAVAAAFALRAPGATVEGSTTDTAEEEAP